MPENTNLENEDKKTILVVDDSEINREILKTIFENDYNVMEAENGKIAVQKIVQSRTKLAAILLDINMPEMDGFEVLEEIANVNLLDRIPVVMITADSSIETERYCYEKGVTDVIRKPFDTIVVSSKVRKSIALFESKRSLQARVDEQVIVLRKQYEQLQQQQEKLKENNNKIIETICDIVEFRNLESGYHLKRIKYFVQILGKYAMQMYPEYGLTKDKIEIIAHASAMHDIGKISIPDTILLKPGRLTKDEFDVMKSHTTRGCEIINMLVDIQDREYYEASYDICRHHHERYDGGGYPDGLKGEEISIAAQLTSLADVYDALVSERVYKAAYPMDKAFNMIMNGECGAFSPKILEVFKVALLEMNAVYIQTRMSEENEKGGYEIKKQ